MARQIYIATVQLGIAADSEAEACDAVSETLSLEDMAIFDWAYLRLGGQVLTPVMKLVGDPGDYEEGEFLQ
jgi:hypothetical protein